MATSESLLSRSDLVNARCATHFFSLPYDILENILYCIRPIWHTLDLAKSHIEWIMNYQEELLWGDYYPNFQPLAQLRLVCKSFDDFITPMLYRRIVIRLSMYTTAPAISQLFLRGAPYIQSLTIDGRALLWDGDSNLFDLAPSNTAVSALTKGLRQCHHIRTLQCIGDHGLYSLREILHPPLASNISSLLYTPLEPYPYKAGSREYTNNFGWNLDRLAPSLEHLHIFRWFGKTSNRPAVPFRPSIPLQRLTQLVIHHSNLPLHHLLELLRWVNTNNDRFKRKRNKRVSPLRSLSLVKNSNIKLPNVLQMLEINSLGHNLTTLRFFTGAHFYRSRTAEGTMHVMISKLTHACPNLLHLSFDASAFCTSLDDCIATCKLQTLTVFLQDSTDWEDQDTYYSLIDLSLKRYITWRAKPASNGPTAFTLLTESRVSEILQISALQRKNETFDICVTQDKWIQRPGIQVKVHE